LSIFYFWKKFFFGFLEVFIFFTSRHFFLLAQKKETPGKERKTSRPSGPLGFQNARNMYAPFWGANFFPRS